MNNISDKKINKNIGERMLSFAKKLFPLNRSLMGPDIRNSFKYFMDEHKEFRVIKFKTGERVFDWEIPEEWIVRDSFIMHESGKKYAEFKKNNLHLMGYSIPINKTIRDHELKNKIFTIPKKPNAIPYVTSYYKKEWGFCMTHEEYKNLPKGKYKVFIDADHTKGELWLLEAVIPGESKKEIFFSSYLCHPSMANNELSGPVVINELINYVKNLKNRKFTYRFVLLPETIGSISFLSKRKDHLKREMKCGFNITCVGDERAYSHLYSRLGNNLADKALSSALIKLNNVKEYSYLERGSDERQYCSPGIDLPICTFCRSKFGEYPEYHSSEDNFNVVSAIGLQGSFKVLANIIDAFELGIYPKIKVFGEPHLGKRKLYPTTSKIYDGEHPSKTRMNIIAYCDSNHNLFEIAKKVNVNLERVVQEIKILNKKGLIDL